MNPKIVNPFSLTFKAGAGARDLIRRHGFDPALIGTIAGASGGAKWLCLSQLDRAIVSTLVPRMSAPVHLIGSSIGAWRFACYAQAEPLAAIERFEEAYLEQRYSENPDIDEITAMSRSILDGVLGERGVAEILDNDRFRTHILAVRAKHALASENKWVLSGGLLAAASLNLLSRRSLGLFFERALFYDERDVPPFFDLRGFPLQQVALTARNLRDAIVASGSIPLVLSGVPAIAGARSGVYRDGGVIDYHLDIPHSDAERLTLYPHFFGHIVPGWFDKALGWRRPSAANVDRTLLISPSPEFVATLPGAKIPDRGDFQRYAPAERRRVWRECIAACRQMADEFVDVIESDRLAALLEPL